MKHLVNDAEATVLRTVATPCLTNVDLQFRDFVDEISQNHDDYWSFKHASTRPYDYSLFQYPAMMVPEMQRVLIRALVTLQNGAVTRLLDPFVGSGTVLWEGMLLGLNASGQDINPLAILLTQAKTGPYDMERVDGAFAQVIATAKADTSSRVDIDFVGREKWFREEVSIQLSRLRRAIQREDDIGIRRFLWATLAETVRLTSNSRTSTYKLHIRPATQLIDDQRSPQTVFERLANRNGHRIQRLRHMLEEAGHLHRETYAGSCTTFLEDTRNRIGENHRLGYDMVVTSPPYGDNKTTVPYGQSSYLPLQWIPRADIGTYLEVDDYLTTTLEIDSRSLGGRARKGWREEIVKSRRASPTLDSTLRDLETSNTKSDRVRRVAVFSHDLFNAVRNITRSLNVNGYMVWTIGNRRVGGIEIPSDNILRDFLEQNGMEFVHSVQRPIISKRMPSRNQLTSTMGTEAIMVFRKSEIRTEDTEW